MARKTRAWAGARGAGGKEEAHFKRSVAGATISGGGALGRVRGDPARGAHVEAELAAGGVGRPGAGGADEPQPGGDKRRAGAPSVQLNQTTARRRDAA